MEVISMVVNDEFGVMQRIMGEFTRRKINVDTIVVGKCEMPGKSRVVLSVSDRKEAEWAVDSLQRLQDIVQVEIVDDTRQESYALVANTVGKARLIGSIEEVEKMVQATKPDKYIRAVNAI
ncbi:MAG TPA: ACT domain-containing protein [Methanomassiliicoccales archaeon]|nr:ACT domain-containing protein [Methanomassiliicoccales archaeon]